MKVFMLAPICYLKNVGIGDDHIFILQDRKVYDLPDYWARLLIEADAAAEYIKYSPEVSQ